MGTENRRYDWGGREQKRYERIRRLRRERRRKCLTVSLTAFATFCLVMICAVSYRTIHSNAGDGFKYYTSVVVEPGDSVWEIADQYMDDVHYDSKESYIFEVRSINHLDEACSVTSGQMLIVPYYSAEYVQ